MKNEIFDVTEDLSPDQENLLCTAIEGLLEQGLPSATEALCKYLGPNGRKCAVGQLIADENYHSELEGLIVNEISVQEAIKLSWPNVDVNDDLVSVLMALQRMHDSYYTAESKVLFRSRFLTEVSNIISKEYVNKLNALVASLNEKESNV